MNDEAPPFSSLTLADLAPLLDGSPSTSRPRLRWPYSPFAYWLATTRTAWRVAGSGPAFDEVCALIPEAGRCYERPRIGETAVDLLVLDGPWDADTIQPKCWEPLLAPGAIVLVHGIHPGSRASRLWCQWLIDAPGSLTFALSAGSGLGLLLNGAPCAPPAVRALCTLSPESSAVFERACKAAAARWESARRDAEGRLRVAQLQRHIASLRRVAERHDEEVRAVIAEERARAEVMAQRAAAIEASHTWRAGLVFQGMLVRLPAPLRAALRSTARAVLATVGRLAKQLRAKRELFRRATARPALGSASSESPPLQPVGPVPLAGRATWDVATRRRRSGHDLPHASILRVAIGFVAADTTITALRRAVAGAQLALQALGQDDRFRVIVADDGFPVPLADLLPTGVVCVPRAGPPGAAAAHNRMMKMAFEEGADVYVAGDPDATFDPDAVTAILRLLRANGQVALISPATEPSIQPPMAEDFGVPWVDVTGLTVSRRVQASLGDLDERMDMAASAVDLSLRCRAAGIPVLRAAEARYQPLSDQGVRRGPGRSPEAIASALLLAHKWQDQTLTVRLSARLERLGRALPALPSPSAGASFASGVLTAWWDSQEPGLDLEPSDGSPTVTAAAGGGVSAATLPKIDPAVLPPEDLDACLGVPFSYVSAEVPLPSFRIATMLHLFYEDLATETLEFLRHVPVPIDLLITTDTTEKRRFIEAAFAGWRSGRVEVFVVPNRGADIAPRLDTLRDAHARYDLVLYLHGKKSLHWKHGHGWREYLYKTLLGSSDLVRSILAAFAANPALGIVMPEHWDLIRSSIDWGYSFADARDLAARLGIDLRLTQPLEFPSGSMFWARPAALQPLLDLGLTAEDFPEGSDARSTYAHAIERLLLRICERSGYDWIKIADPSLLTNHRGLHEVRSPDELARLLRDLPFRLSDPALPRGRAEVRA